MKLIKENLLLYTKIIYGDNFKNSQQDVLEYILLECYKAGWDDCEKFVNEVIEKLEEN